MTRRRKIEIAALTPRRPVIQAAHAPLAQLIDDAGLLESYKPFYFASSRTEHFEALFEFSCFEVVVTLDIMADQQWFISATAEHEHTLKRAPWGAAAALVAAVLAETAGGLELIDDFEELRLGQTVSLAEAKKAALLTLAHGRERRLFSRSVVVNEA